MRHLLLFGLLCTSVATQPLSAQLNFEREPIEYSKSQASDPVAVLIKQIRDGRCVLRREDPHGYLAALLETLDVPLSSQTLVFSKTSLQRHLISPANPRAIYFNDDTYVAWVPDGKMIEIASIDPMLGTVFYSIDQGAGKRAGVIERRNQRCLFCHASSDTGRVPGLLMRSVYTDHDGNRVFSADAIPTDSKGPLQGRWAGWFVSGTHGRQRHLGNLMINDGANVTVDDVDESANVTDLSRWFDVEKYVSPHSDIVALLVLRHQVSLHDLLIDANHRSRIRLHREAQGDTSDGRVASISAECTSDLNPMAEQVVDGLLMVGEASFSDPANSRRHQKEPSCELENGTGADCELAIWLWRIEARASRFPAKPGRSWSARHRRDHFDTNRIVGLISGRASSRPSVTAWLGSRCGLRADLASQRK